MNWLVIRKVERTRAVEVKSEPRGVDPCMQYSTPAHVGLAPSSGRPGSQAPPLRDQACLRGMLKLERPGKRRSQLMIRR